jgi:dephospho-CoA kinase
MKKIGITGNIGSGKSTVSDIIKKLGYKVFESDQEVSKLLDNQEIVRVIKEEFNSKIKGLIKKDKIDRSRLSDFVFSNATGLKKLESIIHPKVWEEKEKFFIKNIKEKIVFLDIPLLFEKKLQSNFNYIIYTFVAKRIQKERVLNRKNMNEKKLNQIISNQNKLSNHQKKRISLKLNTNKNIVEIKRKIEDFLSSISS